MNASEWFVSVVLVGISVNLLSSQVNALLPGIARWIVRRQAARMGDQRFVYEEEWLALIDETPGSLAKLFVAIGTAWVPLLTRVEMWRDLPQQDRTLTLAVWIRDHAGGIVVPAMALLLGRYPMHPARYAAYAVLIPLVVLWAVCFSGPLRRWMGSVYERCSYAGRVSIGGLPVPLVACLVLALTFIPLSRRGRVPGRSDLASKPSIVVVLPPGSRDFVIEVPTVTDGAIVSNGDLEGLANGRVVPEDLMAGGLPKTPPVGENPVAPPDSPQATDATALESQVFDPSNRSTEATVSVPEAIASIQVESLTISERPSVPLPEQPIPSQQLEAPQPEAPRGGPPAPPSSLRLVLN